jgi:nicotinamidase/pyrazinamidase
MHGNSKGKERMIRSLVIVDVQNDFSQPNGALHCPNGAKRIEVINSLIVKKWDHIIATMDAHNDYSEEFNIYRPHCKIGTWGQEFDSRLYSECVNVIFKKGQDKAPSYSGVKDSNGKETGLGDMFHGFENVYVVGVATDVCVMATAIDLSPTAGRVIVIEDACWGITEKGHEEAIEKLKTIDPKRIVVRKSSELDFLI